MHIQNRCPTAAVPNKTPEEAWNGEKPVVDYFRIFRCIAHVHVPDQRRSKLDDKSRKCVFLGVSDESNAWRLYDPVSKKILISKDVVFEEEEEWDWGRTEEEIKQDTLEWEDKDESDGDGDDDQNNEENGGTSSDNSDSNLHDGMYEDNSESNTNSLGSSLTESPPNEPNPDTHGELTEGRSVRGRRAPSWMADYETGEGLFEDDNLNAMMVTENDPVLFEEAVRSKK